jgi:hypothetical protein
VREGVAGYYADPDLPRADARPIARAACPRDGELVQPLSPGALVDALTRAQACVARQIAAGRSWREIK